MAMAILVYVFYFSALLACSFAATTPRALPQSSDERDSGISQESVEWLFCPEIANTARGVQRIEGDEVRFDPEVNKCGFIGFRQHCPKGMTFYEDADSSTNGYCDCETNAGWEKPLVSRVDADGNRRCYKIFEHGYCPSGQWLIPSDNGMPICVQRKCVADDSNSTWVLFKNECTRSLAFHAPCGENMIIAFHTDGKLEPKCTFWKFRLAGAAIRRRPCKPGTYLTLTGKCPAGFSWRR